MNEKCRIFEPNTGLFQILADNFFRTFRHLTLSLFSNSNQIAKQNMQISETELKCSNKTSFTETNDTTESQYVNNLLFEYIIKLSIRIQIQCSINKKKITLEASTQVFES